MRSVSHSRTRFNRAGATAGASTRQHTTAMFSTVGFSSAKPGHVEIEVLVVHVLHQALGDDLLEAPDVEHVPGLGVDLAFTETSRL